MTHCCPPSPRASAMASHGRFIGGLRGPAQCTTFDAVAIDRGEAAVVHAIRRDGTGQAACALGAPFHAVHHANAWDVGCAASRTPDELRQTDSNTAM